MVAEPSGSGKTHSVYSLGKKGFVFHCRVSNHGEELTLPWKECVERIESISTLKDSGEDNFRCAKSAQLMVQLLIIAYYEIALRVLQIGFRETHDFSSALRFSYTRELLLRFFSHDQAAVIVADFYKSLLNVEVVENFLSTPNTANLTNVTSYVIGCLESAHELRNTVLPLSRERDILIFNIDEVQCLLTRFPGLFVQQGEYRSEKVRSTGKDPSRHYDFKPGSSEEKKLEFPHASSLSDCNREEQVIVDNKRSLFHSVAYSCLDFQMKQKVGICFTGRI
jgi:hypothetical protein